MGLELVGTAALRAPLHFATFDNMNNWVADNPGPPKYMTAIVETYVNRTGDDFYANSPVTYLKTRGWPADRRELGADRRRPEERQLLHHVGRGAHSQLRGDRHREGSRTISADVGVDVSARVRRRWCGATGRGSIARLSPGPTCRRSASTGLHPIRRQREEVGALAVWDSAGNGAMVQPIKLQAVPRMSSTR